MLKIGRIKFSPIVHIMLIAALLFAWQFSYADTAFEYDTSEAGGFDISLYQASRDTETYRQPRGGYVKNVIMCIGDGISTSQITLARIRAAGIEGKLFMERMPFAGLVYTHSNSSAVTDSAAGGTALACGVKTNNGRIGMTEDKVSYETILEAAKEKGFRTGLVATSTITHATPASFGSHVEHRSNEQEIAGQYLDNEIYILLGGGKKHWLPKSVEGGSVDDGRNLIDEAIAAGYTFVDTRAGLFSAEQGPLLGLFQSDAMTTVKPEPTIAEMTTRAIELLDKKSDRWFAHKPRFFLMVEGSQIDWVCHANDEQKCIMQVLQFDQAVKAAIEFAIQDRRTLVLVTADHETGGLAIQADPEAKGNVNAKWASKSHTGVPVPIFAYGPGAETFSGVYDNTEVPVRIAKLLGIKEFPKKMSIPSPVPAMAK